MNIIKLKTVEQVALWKYELSGQVSDGHWENSRPLDHYKKPCGAQVVQDPIQQGINFYCRRYNFTSKKLLDVVGVRMINLAKLAKFIKLEDVGILNDYLFNFCTYLGTGSSEYRYTGPPNYLANSKGEHYDNVRQVLSSYDHKDLCDYLETIKYTRKDLIADLNEIKKAFNTQL